MTTSLLSRLSLAFITIPLFAQDAVDIALSITQIPTEYNERLPPYTLDDGLWAFDCSGLVQYSYLNASNSLTLPRTAADQSQIGTVVGPPYQRGDLMFFATLKPGEVGHVGIVVDADMMIDANSYDGKVEQESYNTAYWRSVFLFAKRLPENYPSPPVPTTGTIIVQATLDGVSWAGPLSFYITGPYRVIIGMAVGISLQSSSYDLPVGSYTISYSSGGPSVTGLYISPSTTQAVTAGQVTTFTLAFSSRFCSAARVGPGTALDSVSSLRDSASSCASNPPALTATCSCLPSTVLTEQSSTCSALASGGAPPLTYVWTTEGSALGSSASISVAYNMSGSHIVGVRVYDSGNPTVQTKSAACSVQVNPSPVTASCLVNGSNTPITVNSGTQLNYAISASGGKSPYHYSWNGVSGAGDTSVTSVTPAGYASISVSALVKDSSTPVTSTTATCPTVTINPPSTGTVAVVATMNGQAYSGAMACGFLNSPSNFAVNSVPFSQSNLPLGTYNLNCAGGPPNSALQSFSPSASQTLTAGGTITFTAIYVWATVTVYSNPLPVPSGSWTWYLSGWSSSGSSWITQPVLTVAGVNYTYNHPEQYILALQQIQSWGATGSFALMISQLQNVLSSWPPYVVVPSPTSAPTVGGIYTPTQPLSDVFFSGNVSGTGFVPGNTTVYFCVYNTTTCYLQPAAGVTVNSSISLSVYNVYLTGGAWQVKVVTPYGTGIGPVFYVQ